MEKINGILLENRKHSDTLNIVTLYTRTRGRISFISPAGSGPKARIRAARLLPLALVDAEIRFSKNKDLQRLGAITSPHTWQDIYFHPVKRSMALFLMEFLNKVLRDTTPDPLMWDYICESIRILDERKGSAPNFHIAFLIGLLRFAGIHPDTSGWCPGMWFSLESAEFVISPARKGLWLDPHEASVLPVLDRMNYRNMDRYRFNGDERRRILGGLMRFYGIHFPGADNLNSMDVLRELFH